MSELRGASAPGTDVRDLRLAVVLYGGVSLAIYMHGTTRELHALVRASRLREAGLAGSVGGSQGVYAELLGTLATMPGGVQLRVVLDVVAGTSAGGINGIYLAKALAHDRSLGSLRDLWLENGDIARLLRGPEHLWIGARLPGILARVGGESPLHGDLPAQWHYDALVAMDAAGSPAVSPGSLVPSGHRLDLFVTVTDFHGYDRHVPIDDPPVVRDRRHRHVLAFGFVEGDLDELGPRDNDALAFAARTTSSFPGAFPPVSIDSFARDVGDRPVVVSRLERRFRHYELAGADARATAFVDGGVLDNRPFELAIAAIRSRPANAEVDRRLLYVEPDPGGATPPPDGELPSPISTVLGAVAGIPRREPILDALLSVGRGNEGVQRIQDIVETSFEPIARRIEEVAGGDLDRVLAAPTGATSIAEVGRRVHAAARVDAGFAYASYVRTKIVAVVDRVAALACRICDFPADSSHEVVVRAVLRAWAERQGLLVKLAQPSDEQVSFLRSLDVGYRVRRLQFVIAAINAWYREVGPDADDRPPRAELDDVKARLWGRVRDLGLLEAGHGFAERELARSAFPVEQLRHELEREGLDPAACLARRGRDLDALMAALTTHVEDRLREVGEGLFGDAFSRSAAWSPARRRELLVRYLGFPFWDCLLLPVQSRAELGEQDQIDVLRLSPLDVSLLTPPSRPKLGGVKLGHFGAFFDRGDRERDYLWGRLDGAERLVRLVLAQADGRPRDGGRRVAPAGREDEVRAWCDRLFRAIVAEEADLKHARDLADAVLGQLDDPVTDR
ncbi:MAG: patatin-like protein [Thermoleophilia bacterium]